MPAAFACLHSAEASLVLAAGELDRVRAAVAAGYRTPDGAPPQIMVEHASRTLAGNIE